MKAISVREPWARCIALGRKPVENRGRHTKHRGLVAIHTSGTTDYAATSDGRVVRALGLDPLKGAVLGAVIAVAELVDCHEVEQSVAADGICCAPWGERWYHSPSGRRVPAWHLALDNVRRVEPVLCLGKVMIPWELPPDVAAAVERQLVGVA